MTRKPGPSGITISTDRGERIGRLRWQFGFGLRRVTFADHRSGWSGINLYLYFFCWAWSCCLLRWRTRYGPVSSVRSLREQIRAEHGDPWEKHDADVARQQAALELENKRVMEEIRRRQEEDQ